MGTLALPRAYRGADYVLRLARPMTPTEIKALREKHQPVFQNIGRAGDLNYCAGCKGPNGTLINLWPCDAAKALEYCD